MKRRTYLASFLTLLICGGVVVFGATTLFNRGEASALSYQSSEPLSFTFAPTVQITISDNLTIPSLSPGDGKDSNIITVTAASNSTTGYVLSSTVGSSTGNASTELRRNGTDTTYKFTNLASNKSSLSDFDTNSNTWGYSYCTSSTDCTSTTNWISGDITGTPTTGYNGLPLYTTESPIKLINSTDASTSSIQFKIGARATTTQVAGEYTNVVNFIGLANPNPTRSFDDLFYAAGKTKYHGYYTMQDMNATICSNAEQGSIAQLIDIRDGEVYRISKLKDDRCWLLDNLRLDLTNSTILNGLTTTNTHADAASLTSLKSGNRSAGNQYASSGFATWAQGDTNNVFNQAKANADYKDTVNSDSSENWGPGSHKYGVYYNYCAASAGSYCYDSGAGAGNAQYDLCPAGWRMPTGGSSGEYNNLYTNGYSSDATNFRNALSTPLSGYFYGGSARNQGDSGSFWSSTRHDGYSMYNLYVASGNVDPASYGYRDRGISVRCVLGS